MAKSKNDTNISNDPMAMGKAMMQQMEDAGFGPMRWFGSSWAETLADMNSELASFIADRVREDADTQQKLLQCKSAEELQKVQYAFMEKAYAQYTAESGKLVKMGLDMLPIAPKGTKHTPV